MKTIKSLVWSILVLMVVVTLTVCGPFLILWIYIIIKMTKKSDPMTITIRSKSDLRNKYEICRSTLLKWVGMIAVNDDCPFTFDQYKKKRALPGSWIEYITKHLGS